jgi:hypothetical protein
VPRTPNGFFVAAFSGKLSLVKSNSEEHPPKMQPTEPAAGDQPWSEAPTATAGESKPQELGGREGPEPTRFGDWELRGRCIDF